MSSTLSKDLDFSSAFALAVASGLALHLAFNKLEKTHLPILKWLLLAFPLLPASLLWQYYSYKALLIAYTTSYATLITSTLAYRLSPLHPLCKYPGPALAKCTKFWGVYQTYTGKAHATILDLHRQYGSVVRTGPNELSITDVDAVQPVLGSDGLRKGPIWDGRRVPGNKIYGLIGIRNTAEHLQRRKYWNKGLSTTSVKEYQPILKKRVDQLVDVLKSKALEKKQVDLAEYISFFAYDFMGDMAFGGGFELMRDGDINHLWKLMENGIRIQSYTQHIPWAASLLLKFASTAKDSAKLRDFAIEQSKKRVERGVSTGLDLSSHFLGEVSNNLKPMEFGVYSSEAFLIIIAGSDTTATVLSSVFSYLISNREIFDRLKGEIEEHYPRSEGIQPTDDMSKLGDMPLLNGVINEGLRLAPPVPTGVQRATDDGNGLGKLVGSIYVPEGTAVSIPPYAIHRDYRYFSPNPDSFNPDRWSKTDPSIETNSAAFIPYSSGPMNCAGKLLAQLELRIVVASLVREFDFRFPDGWDATNWDKGLEDMFVFKKGKLPVIISV